MTTITLEIPDSARSDISNFVKERGGNILNVYSDDEDISETEMQHLERGLKEALLIKEGKIKSIPFSELWDE